MKNTRLDTHKNRKKHKVERQNLNRQNGSAIIIALLVMALLMGFVALAVSRTSNETVASSNDTAETLTFEASHASLEIMTHNFDKIFDYKLSPSNADLERIQSQYPPGFEDEYSFIQTISQTEKSKTVVMTGQLFQGLNAIRDEWQIDSVATSKYDNVEVALRRKFYNNKIPIFQFGIFYEDDLEFHPGPRFDFGGRVHSNRHLFLRGNNLYFSSKVSSSGEIFTDVMKNGKQFNKTNGIRIKNASGNFVVLNSNMGSVLNQTVSGTALVNEEDMPIGYSNPSWDANAVKFEGNLLARQTQLDLPIKIDGKLDGNDTDYISIIQRGKNLGDLYSDSDGDLTAVDASTEDNEIVKKEKYYNKPGVRISLADSKAKLPGCASGVGSGAVTDKCGIRLDGNSEGTGAETSSANSTGYTPLKMTDGYQATRINGKRFYRSGNETWIKVEAVSFDEVTGTVATVDVTEEFLSLGVTEQAPIVNVGTSSGKTKFAITESNYHTNNTDSRSVIKLQRFIMAGAKIENSDSGYLTSRNWNSVDYNLVVGKVTGGVGSDNAFADHTDHYKDAIVEGFTGAKIVPFPIKMFDTREGLYNDSLNTGSVYGNNLPSAGVFSLIDIDVANLKKVMDGNYDGKFPKNTVFHLNTGVQLKSSDIPDNNGWVFYISDRRGDADFDGEYDMEDIYGNNDGILQFGEDVNNNGILDTNYINEAVKYTGAGSMVEKGLAATVDHNYYRRGVRLINGTSLPGKYDSGNPFNTKGFTVASENGIYTLGNYNSTGISSVGSPTASTDYRPLNTPDHIPASIVGDTITVLSNKWRDANSFKNAFSLGSRVASETTIRFALISGDSRASLIEPGEPNQGGGDLQLSGGVHNFKRTLEKWSGKRLNYSGSLINLYNSRNSNGTFKCCSKVYSPPTRNWIFESSFLDAHRLPPGTPFFQTIQLTGFQRLN